MKLTSFTDYSLRVLVYLATQAPRRATTAEIAEAFGISENHLTKVVHLLCKRGWIETVRGKGGGMRLAREPWDICIGDVVRDTEGRDLPAECFAPDGGDCVITSCCKLKHVLAEAISAFYGVLDQYTLADLSRNQAALAKILMFHPAARA